MLKTFFKPAAENDAQASTTAPKTPQSGGLTKEQALAQYILSGTVSNGFYLSASAQFRKFNQLCEDVSPQFLAKMAVYALEKAHMQEVPTYLLALLSLRDIELARKIFPRIMINGRMLRQFTQIIRSGAIGRRSFGTSLVRMIGDWLNALEDRELLALYVGKNPSLKDILRLIHPRPQTAEREAFYGWICQVGTRHLGYNPETLPPLIKGLEAFLKGETAELSPHIPHELLISKSGYNKAQWEAILQNCTWNQLRHALNLFQRNNVFQYQENIDLAVHKLTAPAALERVNVHPQSLYASFSTLDPALPAEIKEALNVALEFLLMKHLPDFKGHQVALCVNLSSTMFAPINGYRGPATAKIPCADIASMSAAMVLKKNPENTLILPFAAEASPVTLNPDDPILTNMRKLKSLQNGNADCSAPLGYLLDHDIFPDILILISDNVSWIESDKESHKAAALAYRYWQKIHEHNPNASLICWNLVPNHAPQLSKDTNLLHLAGYSERLFQVILRFSNLLPLKKSSTQRAEDHAKEISEITL